MCERMCLSFLDTLGLSVLLPNPCVTEKNLKKKKMKERKKESSISPDSKEKLKKADEK